MLAFQSGNRAKSIPVVFNKQYSYANTDIIGKYPRSKKNSETFSKARMTEIIIILVMKSEINKEEEMNGTMGSETIIN